MSKPCDETTVTVTMRFINDSPKWQFEKPYLILSSESENGDCAKTNIDLVDRTCIINDLRYTEPERALGSQFFRLVNHESKYLNSLQQQGNDSPYVRETVDLLKDVFRADTVIAYNVRFRRNQKNHQDLEAFSPGTFRNPDLPSFRPHVGKDCARRRVRRSLNEEEAQKYLGNSDMWRFRIVNVWRPLCAQVNDTPLAFCDPRSVNVDDMIAVDRPSKIFHAEMYMLNHKPNQQWYYLSNQKPHEVYVFVSWDSGVAAGSVSGIPHSAFRLPDWEQVPQLRESVEVRAIVIEPKDSDTRDMI